MNKPNDAAEPSLASAGSHGDGMVARLRSWRDERGYPTPGEMLDEAADEIERLRANLRLADAGFTLGPPTLTDEEREAIAGAMWDYGQYADELGLSVAEVTERQAALRGLLDRTK